MARCQAFRPTLSWLAQATRMITSKAPTWCFTCGIVLTSLTISTGGLARSRLWQEQQLVATSLLILFWPCLIDWKSNRAPHLPSDGAEEGATVAGHLDSPHMRHRLANEDRACLNLTLTEFPMLVPPTPYSWGASVTTHSEERDASEKQHHTVIVRSPP